MLQSLFSKSTPPFSVAPFFSISPMVRINKMVVNNHPSLSRLIRLKDASSHIHINFLGLFLSPKYFLNFLLNLYIQPKAGKKINQINGVQITGKGICKSK